MSNPYSLVFGNEPDQLVSRTIQNTDVISTFNSESPSGHVYLITGVRGCGKTSLMTSLSNTFKGMEDWIAVDLNPENDLLQSLGAKLYSDHKLASIMKSLKINLSLFGFNVEVTSEPAIIDLETAVEKMIEHLQKHGKKLLITIDEVTNTKYMRSFTGSFQIFVRHNLPVFLLMTGLFENITSLQDEKSLTFLYRAPKIKLPPLNIGAIQANYDQNFDLPEETTLEMAKLTRGYAYGFQVMGYLTYQHGGFSREVLTEFYQYMDEYVYEKIWSELSPKDKKVIHGIASTDSNRIVDIRKTLQMETNEFNPYRKRLVNKGLIDGDQYGQVSFILPGFERFVITNYMI